MSGIAKAFETLSTALSDASATLEKLRNGEIAPDQILSEYIKRRDRSDLNALYTEFKDTFGSEGDIIAARPALSEELNGNLLDSDEAREQGFFVGLMYSYPLMNYMMRRALNKESPDKCYELYLKGVDTYAADSGENPEGHYPSQELLERITAEPLAELVVIAEQKAEQDRKSNGSDIDPPDNTEYHI